MSDQTTLSPAQCERLERLTASHPATTFDVVDVDPYSLRVIVEAEDLEGFSSFCLTAAGRAFADLTF
jgi:hypothetical protein